MSEQEERKEENASPTEAEAVCHMLPCSIDYSGRAHGATHFFRPMPIHQDNNGDTTEKQILAAALRGRGLLGQVTSLDGFASQEEEKQDKDAQRSSSSCLRLFKVDPNGVGLTVQGPPMHSVVDWQHEHNPTNLTTSSKKSRLATAKAWMQVAQALHDPLPPPEQF